jgi:hypothetical protein
VAAKPKKPTKRAPSKSTGSALERIQAIPLPTRPNKQLTKLEAVIIQLYGRGLTNSEVARLVAGHMYPEWRHNRAMALRMARGRLRKMEATQWFRDALYDAAVVKTDLSIPQIMEGVVRKAKRGRVDAAKLALAVAGRGVESEGAVNVPIQINFRGDVPRPYGIASQTQAQDDEEIEDAEWDED